MRGKHPEVKTAGEMVSGQDGGYLTPERWGDTFFGLLRSKQLLSNLPITYIETDARLQHNAKLTGDLTIYYPAENSSITTSSVSFGQVTFQPRKQAARAVISAELVRDAPGVADQILLTQATDQMAVDRDTQALRGNGQAGVPTGVVNATNVTTTSLGTNGNTPVWGNLLSGIANVRNLNGSTNVPVGQAECTGIVAHTRLDQTVALFKDASNRPLWQYGLTMTAPGSYSYLGMNWVLSNLVPITLTQGSATTASEIYFGDWKHLVITARTDLEFSASFEASFPNDELNVRFITRYDTAVAHPEAFFVYTGVLA